MPKEFNRVTELLKEIEEKNFSQEEKKLLEYTWWVFRWEFGNTSLSDWRTCGYIADLFINYDRKSLPPFVEYPDMNLYNKLKDIIIKIGDLYIDGTVDEINQFRNDFDLIVKYKSPKVRELVKETFFGKKKRSEREKLFENVKKFLESCTKEEFGEWRYSYAGEMISMEKEAYAYNDNQKANAMTDDAFDGDEINNIIKEVSDLLYEYGFDKNSVAAIKSVLKSKNAFAEMSNWINKNQKALDKDNTQTVKMIKDKVEEISNR